MLIHGVELEILPELRPRFQGLTHPRDVVLRWGRSPDEGRTRSAVQEVTLPEGRFFLKVYAYQGLWRLRTIFIPARARREFHNLGRLRELGFHVPDPVAYGQERTFGFLSVSFLLTRAIPGAVTLRDLVGQAGSQALPPPAERRRLIAEFARTLRRAHDAGVFLHTLRAKNLLLTQEGGRYTLHVIDVPFAGIGRYRLFPRWGRVRDLACLTRVGRLVLSRTDRMRFARAYGADRALLRGAQSYQERHYP